MRCAPAAKLIALVAEGWLRVEQPARIALHERLAAAQRDGQLPAEADVDIIADALFAPIWFRLLVTKDPITTGYADAVVDAVMSRDAPAARSRPPCRR